MKDIPGYEGLYAITEDGKVWSYPKHFKNGRWMNPETNDNGYVRVSLSKNATQKHLSIHRLVGTAFIPNPENKPEINHKNGIKSDNNASNLEWVTSKENIQHSIDTGLRNALGENNSRAVFTNEQVVFIKQRYKDGCSPKDIRAIFGLPISKAGLIGNILHGRCYRTITIEKADDGTPT